MKVSNVILIFIFFAFGKTGFAQVHERDSVKISQIRLYVLPLDVDYTAQITETSIKMHRSVKCIVLEPGSKVFEYFQEHSAYLGTFVREGFLDVKLLVEIEAETGDVVSMSVARQELARLDNGQIFQIRNFKKMRKFVRSVLPRRVGW